MLPKGLASYEPLALGAPDYQICAAETSLVFWGTSAVSQSETVVLLRQTRLCSGGKPPSQLTEPNGVCYFAFFGDFWVADEVNQFLSFSSL